jgi:hypothetical protein
MKHIRVYGDSFAAKTLAEGRCWPELLGQELDLPVIMNAVSGSSTEYAIKKLISDIQSIEDDIVIFVTSTPGRLHFAYQHDSRPETAAQYLKGDLLSNGKDHEWYYQNKKHIEWWMVNSDNQMNRINHEAYLHLLRSIARSKPNSIFIVLPNSDHHMHIDPVSNPPNFLITQTYLNRISQHELVDEYPEYRDWIRYSKYDFRINHLSSPNLRILTNLVLDAIKSGDMSNITYDKFNHRFLSPITSVADYLKYVELGYLTYSSWAQHQLEQITG